MVDHAIGPRLMKELGGFYAWGLLFSKMVSESRTTPKTVGLSRGIECPTSDVPNLYPEDEAKILWKGCGNLNYTDIYWSDHKFGTGILDGRINNKACVFRQKEYLESVLPSLSYLDAWLKRLRENQIEGQSPLILKWIIRKSPQFPLDFR